jgi:hypothetical protein
MLVKLKKTDCLRSETAPLPEGRKGFKPASSFHALRLVLAHTTALRGSVRVRPKPPPSPCRGFSVLKVLARYRSYRFGRRKLSRETLTGLKFMMDSIKPALLVSNRVKELGRENQEIGCQPRPFRSSLIG